MAKPITSAAARMIQIRIRFMDAEPSKCQNQIGVSLAFAVGAVRPRLGLLS
jgi:hypothetical protein